MERNEAIEVIKKNYPHVAESGSQFETALRFLIPELKESEEEECKKWILKYLYDGLQKSDEQFKGQFNAAIAWLEKQGENTYNKELSELLHKVICRYINDPDIPYSDREKVSMEIIPYVERLEKQGEQKPKFRIGDTIKKKCTGDIVTVSEVDLKNREYMLSNTGFIPFKYEYLWELVEQKSADKVEPKFKKGDIIKEKETGNLFYVNSVEEFGYTLHYKNCIAKGCTMDFKYEDNYELVEQKHAWSEEDETKLKSACTLIRNTSLNGNKDVIDSTIAWLKSLSPQNTWKPSDEQMKMVERSY